MSRIDNLSGLLFRQLEGIGPIPYSERQRILPMLSLRLVARGDYLVRAGETMPTIGYICSGLLRYFYNDAEGKEFTRYFCTTGHFVSPPGGSEGSAYSIQAITDTELLNVSVNHWQSLVETDLHWARVAVATQEHALRMAEKRERSLILENATTRYLDLLDEFPSIEKYVKQYDIASYLGITAVALSRIRGQKAPRG
jgi:CRP-like cAMP-binding protein